MDLTINAKLKSVLDFAKGSDVAKSLVDASRNLAELNGLSNSIPNKDILIKYIYLIEAKDSSEVENIVTTDDEIFRGRLFEDTSINPAVKEVERYVEALYEANSFIKENKEIISINCIENIQSALIGNSSGIRKQAGTKLINSATGEVIYTPPQAYNEIIALMKELESFINDDSLYNDIDPLIKMAIIHYQFEMIHPFTDGNGRTGRILNILYLVTKKLLDEPILYLSSYIIERKSDYYNLLKVVTDNNDLHEWIMFILDAVSVTAKRTKLIVNDIRIAMSTVKHKIRDEHKLHFYSQDLINTLFSHPYTKISYFEESLKVTRQTASSYLSKLVDIGILNKRNFGKYNYYINLELYEMLSKNRRSISDRKVSIESIPN